jgi:outer membrane protein
MIRKELQLSMNRTLALLLAAGLSMSTVAFAQAPAADAAPAGPTIELKPEALPTKVAVIALQAAVTNTNEGQTTFGNIQKKYEPKFNSLKALSAEIDSLKKQVQSLPANTSDEERANRLKAIDSKEKQLQREGEDLQTNYQGEMGEAYNKLLPKIGAAAVKYCQDNGFTLLINADRGEQTPNNLLWFDIAKMDITDAVVKAYNTTSGVAAPAPSAPTPRRSTTPAKPAAPAAKK